jgi:hypothetical protein
MAVLAADAVDDADGIACAAAATMPPADPHAPMGFISQLSRTACDHAHVAPHGPQRTLANEITSLTTRTQPTPVHQVRQTDRQTDRHTHTHTYTVHMPGLAPLVLYTTWTTATTMTTTTTTTRASAGRQTAHPLSGTEYTLIRRRRRLTQSLQHQPAQLQQTPRPSAAAFQLAASAPPARTRARCSARAVAAAPHAECPRAAAAR